MRASGLGIDRRLVSLASSFSIAEGDRCAAEVLATRPRPTAIVAANDMLALGCYSAIEECGLRCPDDVSLVGFNDMPFVDRLTPPLTTVRIPHAEIGAQAAGLILERIEHPESPLKSLLLAPELVVRGSTSPGPSVNGKRSSASGRPGARI
jgi:LacI family transcriptional regulator